MGVSRDGGETIRSFPRDGVAIYDNWSAPRRSLGPEGGGCEVRGRGLSGHVTADRIRVLEVPRGSRGTAIHFASVTRMSRQREGDGCRHVSGAGA